MNNLEILFQRGINKYIFFANIVLDLNCMVINLNHFFIVPSGLFLVLITMGIILAVLIIFFRKKQWISQKDYYDIEKDVKKGKMDKRNNNS